MSEWKEGDRLNYPRSTSMPSSAVTMYTVLQVGEIHRRSKMALISVVNLRKGDLARPDKIQLDKRTHGST